VCSGCGGKSCCAMSAVVKASLDKLMLSTSMSLLSVLSKSVCSGVCGSVGLLLNSSLTRLLCIYPRRQMLCP